MRYDVWQPYGSTCWYAAVVIADTTFNKWSYRITLKSKCYLHEKDAWAWIMDIACE